MVAGQSMKEIWVAPVSVKFPEVPMYWGDNSGTGPGARAGVRRSTVRGSGRHCQKILADRGGTVRDEIQVGRVRIADTAAIATMITRQVRAASVRKDLVVKAERTGESVLRGNSDDDLL